MDQPAPNPDLVTPVYIVPILGVLGVVLLAMLVALAWYTVKDNLPSCLLGARHLRRRKDP